MDLLAQIHNEEGRKLLDLVDEMRQLASISQEISLPQIVVVGQQSSGKSSVLRALSHIPFPTDNGLCTQFATEIVCRRSPAVSTRATIIPARVNEDEQSEYNAFAAAWVGRQITTEQDVKDVIEAARTAMGLPARGGISDDKLRLELSGPCQDHLTIIDLPGLISQDPDGRSGELDQVDNLVGSYLGGERTIILAVVHGPDDRVNQRVFGMFKGYGARTLGVITATDLVDWHTPHGASVKELVLNDSNYQAGFGWHLVRNLSSAEVRAGSDRDEVETRFFAELVRDPAWRGMDHIPLGINRLRIRLGELLLGQIRTHLPEIQRKLMDGQERCRREISMLGDERSTPLQQKNFLTSKARNLSKRIGESLDGKTDVFDLGHDVKSIRDKVRNANEDFADNMLLQGHTWQVMDDSQGVALQHPEDVLRCTQVSPSSVTNDQVLPSPVSKDELHQYIADCVHQNPGTSLRGTFDPSWVGVFFLQQSLKWKRLVLEHADHVCNLVDLELEKMVNDCTGNETGKRLLATVFTPNLKQRREDLRLKMEELLSPYSTRFPATLNRGYENSLLRADKELQIGVFSQQHRKEGSLSLRAGAHIYQCMQLYYGVAINVLVDNVQSLGIENVLLKGLSDILRPESIGEMTQNQLSNLAGESPEDAGRRIDLRNNINDYERGLRCLARHAPYRSHTGTSRPAAATTARLFATPQRPLSASSSGQLAQAGTQELSTGLDSPTPSSSKVARGSNGSPQDPAAPEIKHTDVPTPAASSSASPSRLPDSGEVDTASDADSNYSNGSDDSHDDEAGGNDDNDRPSPNVMPRSAKSLGKSVSGRSAPYSSPTWTNLSNSPFGVEVKKAGT